MTRTGITVNRNLVEHLLGQISNAVRHGHFSLALGFRRFWGKSIRFSRGKHAPDRLAQGPDPISMDGSTVMDGRFDWTAVLNGWASPYLEVYSLAHSLRDGFQKKERALAFERYLKSGSARAFLRRHL
jgi:hypothetical protein